MEGIVNVVVRLENDLQFLVLKVCAFSHVQEKKFDHGNA